MFSFEQFPVYLKTEELIKAIQPMLKDNKVNKNLKDQLYRSTSSILLNIAEGAGKYTRRDKKNFYIIARGSTQETVAIMRLLKIEALIDDKKYLEVYSLLTDTSKMLSGLIRAMNK